MKRKGSITICRTTCNHEPFNYLSIEVRESGSRARFLKMEMSMEDFGKAITGLSEMPCELNFKDLHTVGKVKEFRKELVDIPQELLLFSPNKEEQRQKLEEFFATHPFAEDGWVGSVYEAMNTKNRVVRDDDTERNHHTYSIIFHRFVEPTEEEIVE